MRRNGLTLMKSMVVIVIIAILVAILFPIVARAREEAPLAITHATDQAAAAATVATRELTPYEAGLLYGMWRRCLSVEAGRRVYAATCRLRHRRATETRAEYLRKMGCTSDDEFAFKVGLWESTVTAPPDDANIEAVVAAILSQPPASPPAEWMLYKCEWCVHGQQSPTAGDQVRRHEVQQELAFMRAVLNGLRREPPRAPAPPSGSSSRDTYGSGPYADTLVQIDKSLEAKVHQGEGADSSASVEALRWEAKAALGKLEGSILAGCSFASPTAQNAAVACERYGRAIGKPDQGKLWAVECMNASRGEGPVPSIP